MQCLYFIRCSPGSSPALTYSLVNPGRAVVLHATSTVPPLIRKHSPRVPPLIRKHLPQAAPTFNPTHFDHAHHLPCLPHPLQPCPSMTTPTTGPAHFRQRPSHAPSPVGTNCFVGTACVTAICWISMMTKCKYGCLPWPAARTGRGDPYWSPMGGA